MCRWYQMKISAMWEEGESGSKTPASPARVVQYEGASISSNEGQYDAIVCISASVIHMISRCFHGNTCLNWYLCNVCSELKVHTSCLIAVNIWYYSR